MRAVRNWTWPMATGQARRPSGCYPSEENTYRFSRMPKNNNRQAYNTMKSARSANEWAEYTGMSP